jgi:hypothetical protein
LKWSFLKKKSLSDVHFFREKGHSLSVALEPLAIWNKKLEGLESFKLKKLKIFPKDMYPVPPEPMSGFFYKKNPDEGFFCSLLR